MKILFIGDIYGRTGREALAQHLPALKKQHSPDLVIVNCDNAVNVGGITPSVAKDFYAMGIDLLTGGDHVFAQRELVPHLDREPWVLRPINYPEGVPGRGYHMLKTAQKQDVLVLHAQGRVFHHQQTDNPFLVIEKFLTKYELGKNVAAIFVDFHADATSEKNAMGQMLDGRVSAVVGTHTHIPTADARILPGGTAYMTDVGMTGSYDSVIGADKTIPLQLFRTGLRFEPFKPAEGDATLCGVVIEIDDNTGLSKNITPVRVGGALAL